MAGYADAAGAVGQLAGGIAGVIGGKPTSGVRASIRQTAQGTLRGYNDTGALSLALNQLYNPSYLALGGQNLQGLLFGQAERSYTSTSYDGKKNQTVSGTIPGSPGLIDTINQAQRKFAENNAALNDSYRQTQLDQARKYLPQAQALDAAANPEEVALRRQLGTAASEQLALGDRVNPELARNWQDSNTARYANMGFRPNEGFVAADDFMRYTGGAQALQQQRQGFALDTLGRINATQPSYTQFLLGMNDPSAQQGYGLATGQQGYTYTGNQYDPYNANTTSISNNANANAVKNAQDQASYWSDIGSGTVGTAAAAYGAF